MKETKQSVFATLSAINCNDHTEQKNGLTYLSWAWAWGIVKSYYPSANYEVVDYGGRPYLHDANLGYLVTTKVTIDGETIPMSLPIMDSTNKAQKHLAYTYEVAEWVNRVKTGRMIEKKVEAATMFDINTAIMRCLTKNLAMFGLGHYIYAGEDLPKSVETRSMSEVMLDYKTKASLKQWYATLNPAQQKEIKAQLTTYAGTLAE
jgi:hypothetical protein